ncbi:MAG: arginyltransferase [Gammaproteobacteria bacterium]|nr:arginyltransferase [Gammaproteobacteria bacterium]
MSSHRLPEDLIFYISQSHPCSYLSAQRTINIIADPKYPMSSRTYSELSYMGFRRSGDLVYAPRCPQCNRCLPIRLPVWRFTPSRSQRRNWQRNGDLSVTTTPAEVREEQYQLYRRYIESRHDEGNMAQGSYDEYASFFLSSWAESRFIEFRLDGVLVAVTIIDRLQDGLSAVYTFFDPDQSRRGLGTYAVLTLISLCKQQGLPHLYLGYLIKESPKMSYKAGFRPHQLLHQSAWQEPGQ